MAKIERKAAKHDGPGALSSNRVSLTPFLLHLYAVFLRGKFTPSLWSQRRKGPGMGREIQRDQSTVPVVLIGSSTSPCTSQENVYLLLAKLHALISSSEDLLGCQLSALFISNSLKACPIWMQRETGEALGNADQVEDGEEAGTEGNEGNKIAEFALNDGPILWDYHGS